MCTRGRALTGHEDIYRPERCRLVTFREPALAAREPISDNVSPAAPGRDVPAGLVKTISRWIVYPLLVGGSLLLLWAMLLSWRLVGLGAVCSHRDHGPARDPGRARASLSRRMARILARPGGRRSLSHHRSGPAAARARLDCRLGRSAPMPPVRSCWSTSGHPTCRSGRSSSSRS